MPNTSAINASAINGAAGAAAIPDPLDLYLAAPSPLGIPAIFGYMAIGIQQATTAPLGQPAMLINPNISTLVPDDAVINYQMELGGQRIPISSWQGTLNAESSSFLQAVVPACGPYIATITAEIGNTFIIYRQATFDGTTLEQEMVRSIIDVPRTDQGPTNYTCTIAGYDASFMQASGNQPTTELKDIRSISTYSGGIRVRAAIDWVLRPGASVSANGNVFTVGFINYIVNSSSAYMDIGT